jgi:hypothetical protein
LSRESDQFQSCNWKDLEKLVLTDHSDKNGTTKETKEEDLKKKEKLPKRTDLHTYLNSSFHFLFSSFFIHGILDEYFSFTNDKNTSTKVFIKRNSLNVISFWLGLERYPRRSPHGEGKLLLFSMRSYLPQRKLL